MEENSKQATQNERQTELDITETLWGKIAFLGLATSFVLLLIVTLITTIAVNLWIALPVSTAALVVIGYLVATPYVAKHLRNYGVASPLTAALLSNGLLCGLALMASSTPDNLTYHLAGYEPTTLQMITSVLALCLSIFGGVIILPAAVYVTRTSKLSRRFMMIIFIGLALNAIAFGIGGIVHESALSPIGKLPIVKSVDWKLLPSPLPSGITDTSTGQNNLSSCNEVQTHFAYYQCNYEFEYPGYLSARSQAAINQAVVQYDTTNRYQPTIHITVLRDTSALASFKYHDGQCDLNGLATAGKASRHSDYTISKLPAVKLQNCGKVTTPSGKSLYYDSSNFDNTKVYEPVPYSFYFEQNGDIVLIKIGTEAPQVNTTGSIYYVDPGYQPELYKFVDSFQ